MKNARHYESKDLNKILSFFFSILSYELYFKCMYYEMQFKTRIINEILFKTLIVESLNKL